VTSSSISTPPENPEPELELELALLLCKATAFPFPIDPFVSSGEYCNLKSVKPVL
jgi:hypothetical protein